MDLKGINFGAMPQIAVNVVTKPAEFFQTMPKTGGFLEPLIFAVIMGFISGIIQALLHLFGLGYGQNMMAGFGMIIFMPIAAAIGSFSAAAILFLIWKFMGSQEDYETAYRCGAHLMALSPITSFIGFVPYIGVMINMAIFTYYLVTASIHVHKIPSQKAWLVFGIIGLIFAVLGVVSEYQGRRMASSVEKWRMMGEEAADKFQKSVLEGNTDEMRKQAERMAKEFEKKRRQ